jgi:hypothetical protein
MAKRSNARSRNPDAINLLKDDHSEVSGPFDKYRKARKRLSASQKKRACQELPGQELLQYLNEEGNGTSPPATPMRMSGKSQARISQPKTSELGPDQNSPSRVSRKRTSCFNRCQGLSEAR